MQKEHLQLFNSGSFWLLRHLLRFGIFFPLARPLPFVQPLNKYFQFLPTLMK